jgi:hypothetical protein
VLPQTYLHDQRHGNPGLARFCKYDAVVAGSSMVANFLDSEIQSTLGWKSLNLSIVGSTAFEQRLALDQALATGQVKDVLWGLHYRAFTKGAEGVRDTVAFPTHLYGPDATTPFKYLLSTMTLYHSTLVLTGRGPKDLESRSAWFPSQQHSFTLDAVFRSWRSYVAKPENHHYCRADAAMDVARAHLLTVAKAHPDVRFHLFFPPYSALFRVAELVHPSDCLDQRMQFKRELVRELRSLPNVALYDFEAVDSVTHDLSLYKDLQHYDLATNTQMLHWIAAGEHRVTADNIDDVIDDLMADTRDFAAEIFASDYRHREQLQVVTLARERQKHVIKPASSVISVRDNSDPRR